MSSKKSKKRRAPISTTAKHGAVPQGNSRIPRRAASPRTVEPEGKASVNQHALDLRRLAGFFGSSSMLWVALLLTAPVLIIGPELTVGPRFNEWPLVDMDFWWHLTTGNWILDHHRVPTTDPFSWTHGGEEWIAHEWLAEVILALSYRVGGLAGAILLTWALAVTGFWRLNAGAGYYGLSRRAAAISMIVLSTGFVRPQIIAARPQVWTWTLLAVLLAELAAYDTGRRRTLWLLPPLFALWINLNLTALIGIGCLGAFVLDRLIRRPVDRHVVMVGVASCLALLINPRHVKILGLTLDYLDRDAVRREFILEWMRPNLDERGHLSFAIALLLILPAIWFLVRRKPHFWPAGPLVVLAFQSYQSLRYIPVFLLISFMFIGWLAGQVSKLDRPLTKRSVPAEAPPLFPRTVWTFALPIATIALTLIFMLSVERSQFRRDPLIYNLPEEGVTFYLNNYPGTRLFNTYDYGGYLIYRFSETDNKVFIDGREEMYGEQLVREYLDTALGRSGWKEFLDDQGIETVFVRPWDGTATRLREDAGWVLVFQDNITSIFARANMAHEPAG